jgi:hypothetical protein
MNEQIEKRTLALFGETYTFVSDEPIERLNRAVRTLNECAAHAGHGGEDKKRMIIFCALHVALERERLKERVEELEQAERSLNLLVNRLVDTADSSST